MSADTGQGPTLAIRVLWTDPVDYPSSGVVKIVVHPYFLMFQGLVFVAITLSNNDPQLMHVPFAYRGLVYLLGVLATCGIVFGWIAWRAASITSGREVLNLSPVLFLANAIVIPITDLIEKRVFLNTDVAPLGVIVLVLFYTAMAQIGTALLLAFFGEQMSRDLTPPPQAAEARPASPALTEAPATPAEPAPLPPAGPSVGGVPVDLSTLVSLQAQGNYVEVVTLTDRHRVAGPLSARIAELPVGLGRLVHRSVWVRAGAVKGFHREGRDLIVTLAGGHRVTTAQSRRDEVLPWLQSLLAEGQDQPSNRSD